MADQDLSLVLSYLPDKYRKAYAEGKLTDDDLLSWGKQAGLVKEPKPDFSNVVDDGGTASKPVLPDRYKNLPYSVGRTLTALDSVEGLGRDVADSLKAGVKKSVGAAEYAAADTGSGIAPVIQNLRDTFNLEDGGAIGAALKNMADPSRTSDASVAQEGRDLFTEGTQQGAVAEDAARHRVTGDTVGKIATGIASNPASLLGVAGGPTSIIPSADFFNQEYTNARLHGLSHEDAMTEAGVKAAAMEGVAAIPAGSVFGRIPAVKRAVTDEIMHDAAKLGFRVTNNMAGEAVKMTGITGSGLLVDKANESSNNKTVADYAHSNLPDNLLDLFNTLKDSALTGAVMAGVTSPTEMFKVSAEKGKLASDMFHGQVDSEKDIVREHNAIEDRRRSNAIGTRGTVDDMFGTPEGLPSVEDYHAQRQSDLEQAALDQVQKRHEVDAAYAQNARDKVVADLRQKLFDAQQHLDSLGDDVSSQRARGGRLGLDMTGQGDHAAMIAAAGRVRSLTEQLRQAENPAPAPEQPAPAPFNPGVQQELPLNNSRLQPADEAVLKDQLNRKRQIDEATGLLTEDNDVITNKAKSARAAERRRYAALLVNHSRDIADTDVRAAHVADGMAKWDADHPLDRFVQTERNKRMKVNAKKDAPLPARPAEVADAVAQEHTSSEDEGDNSPIRPEENLKGMDELRKQAGLANESGIEDTGVRTEHVLGAITGGMRRGDVKAVAKHIADKNLVVVDDASVIPENAIPQGIGGYYDGKRVYVVANQLNPSNIMGDLLSISAHEVKHAADFGAGEKSRASLSNLIGDGANKRLNAKIEALAASGDADAAAAVKMAKEGSNPDTYHLELPAYFMNVMRAKRDAKGAAGQLAENVTAMVRSAAKRRFGDKADVNLKDVAYLSDKLLKETAREGKRMTTDKLGGGLEMIAGEKATGAKDVHTKYLSVDGNTKHLFSDAESKLTDDAANIFEDQRNGDYGSAELGEVLDHPELYKQYPAAKHIKVFMDPKLPEGHGSFLANTISISPHTGDAADMRKLLLHEVQHWVQKHEGHAQGSNVEMFRTPEEKEIISKFKDVERKLDSSAAVLKRDSNMQDIAHLVDKVLTRREFLEEGSKRLRNTGKAIDRMQADNIDRLLVSYDNLKTDAGHAELSATRKYHDTLGEREARFTEQNADNPKINQFHGSPENGYFDTSTPAEDSLIVREGKNLGQAKEQEVYRNMMSRHGLGFNVKVFQKAAKRVEIPDNKYVRMLRAQVDFTGGLGRELNEMREDSVGYAALGAHRGMNAFGRINSSVRTMAGMKAARGGDVTKIEESIKKDINANLERIANIPDASRRAAAMSAWVRENPQMRPVADAVNEINQLSKNILAQLIMTHPDPTPAQLRLMNTVADNSFRYATRMFAAFQGEAGREHSRLMVKQYEAGVKALANKGAVPEKLRKNFETYNNALKYLIDHDLTIPAREGMEALSTERLSQLYDTWVGNAQETRQRARAAAEAEGQNKTAADATVREVMIEKLNERAKYVNDGDLQGKAKDIINGMLGLTESASPYAHYYRGFAQDRGILQHREQLPQEIRDLFGEITDPATRLAVTIAKQSELVGRTKLLLDMKEHGENKWVIPPEKAGLPGNEKFTATLKGTNYGPLNGWRTEPRIAEAIGSQLEVYSTLTQALAKSYTNTEAALAAISRAGFKGITSLAAKQKLASVVFDLYNIGNNFAGSAVGAISNGVVNPKAYLDGLRVGAEVVADTATGGQRQKSSKDYEDAIRYGILDSARVQEIRSTPQQVIRQMISDESKAYRQAKSSARRSARTVVETFAMSDAWTKITAWKDRVATLEKFYKAEGIEKTSEEIKREAADTIKDTSITYSRVPPVIRTAESIGATTFMPYFYSVPRVIVNNYRRGFHDLFRAHYAKTGEGKMVMLSSGLRRIAGASASTYGFVLLTKGIAAAMNGDDKDKADEMKKLMQDDARFSDSVYLGKDDAGVPLFARISRTDAFGPVNDLLRVALDDKLTPEEKSRHALETVKGLFFTNRVTQTIAKGVLGAFTDEEIKDKKTKLERIMPNSMEHLKDAITSIPGASLTTANTAIELLDSLTPGILDSLDPKNKAPSTFKDNDPWLNFFTDMTLITGGRLDRADPNTAAYLATQKIKQARDEGRKRMADGFNAGSDPKDMVRRYMQAANNEYLGMQQANDAYEGMTNGLDMTPRQASEIFKNSGGASGGLTAADIAGLRTGKLNQESEDWIRQNSAILSEGSLQKRTQDSTLSKEEQKQKDTNVKEFLRMMKAMGLNVRGN